MKSIKLDSPKDVRSYIEYLIIEISNQGKEIEKSKEIADLLSTWQRLWDLDKGSGCKDD